MAKKRRNNKPRNHPANHEKNHAALGGYVFSRVDAYHTTRRNDYRSRYDYIDRMINGYIILNEEDRKRRRDQILGKSLKPTDINLPLVFTQLDDAVTFLMQIFSPNNRLFTGIGDNIQEQKATNAFVDLLNNHASVGSITGS